MMTAEEAMKQVSEVIDDYIEGRIRELRALARIAQIIGHYGAGK